MSKLMLIVGILFAAVGIALALMVFVSPGAMQVYGLTFEVAAIFLVGGALATGLGGLIDVVEAGSGQGFGAAAAAEPGYAAATVATAAVASRPAAEPLSPSVRDTIRALEQARSNLEQAFDEKPAAAAEPVAEPLAEPEPAAEEAAAEEPAAEEPAAEPEAEETAAEEPVAEEAEAEEPAEAAEEEVPEEGQLYVVEERTIRGHPARVLSDGTVEAETSEGWMRFENLDHLDEYLDAMEPTA